MMEEVNDDTNGESTFEFVGGKSDDIPKGDSFLPQSLSSEEYSVPTNTGTAQNTNVHISSTVQSQLPPLVSEGSSISSSTNITFYNPSQHSNIVLSPTVSQSTINTQLPSNVSTCQEHSNTLQSFQESASLFENQYQTNIEGSSLAVPLPLDVTCDVLQQGNTESGVWGWLKGKDFLNKMAEKAKNSVDSVITTLDPGMKEIINSGGDINVLVASGSETKVSAIREAFQQVFGKATVHGIPVQSTSIAPQPVGFSAGLKAAEERISNLRQQALIEDAHILLAVENFLVELTPENWFDIGCLLLQDYSLGIFLQVYTQAVPISSHFVSGAKEQTPPDYPLGWSGFAVTIGQLVGPAVGVHHSEWHQALTGVSRREMLLIAAKTIAGLYKNQLQHKHL